MTYILLADDNPELRSALRLVLQTCLEVEVITEAWDVDSVLALVEAAPPDFVILDWELPGRPVSGRVALLRARAPGVKVIALSARPEAEALAFAEGVDAFISKTSPADQILEIIHSLIIQSANP